HGVIGTASAIDAAWTIRRGERAPIEFRVSEDAETNQTAGVRRAIRPGGRTEGFTCEIDGCDQRIRLTRCGGKTRWVVRRVGATPHPSFPIAEDPLPCFVCEYVSIDGRAQVGDVLIPQRIEERFVLHNGAAKSHRVVVNVSPVRPQRSPRARLWIDLPVVAPCVRV